jgi:hypothetical protein
MRQIRAAYVARARLAHPDLVGRKGLDVMRSLNEAWAVLKDAARKSAWDVANQPPGSAMPPPGAAQQDAGYRPFWTGAMGRPPGHATGSILRFGIYEGWSLGEIARKDRGYLIWLRDKPEGQPLLQEIARLVTPNAEAPAADPRDQRRRR